MMIWKPVPRWFAQHPGSNLPMQKQVALALRRLTPVMAFLLVGELFGVVESTSHCICQNFTKSFVRRAHQHLKWPKVEETERGKANLDLKQVLRTIVACCILHNIVKTQY